MDTVPTAFVKQAAFAAHRGVSRKTVTDWKQQGLLVFNTDGLVDVAASEQKLDERPTRYRGGVTSVRPEPGNAEGNKVTPSDSDDAPPVIEEESDDAEGIDLVDLTPEALAKAMGWKLAGATRVKEIYLALRRKREFDVEMGQLVPIDEVGKQVEAEYSVVRERLLTVPGKLAASLVGLSRPEIEAALQDEINEALSELHDPAVTISDGLGGSLGGGSQDT